MSDTFTVETLFEIGGDSLRQSFIAAASVEERLRGLTLEECLRGFTPDERIRALRSKMNAVGLNREEKLLLIEALRLSIEADEAS